MSAKAKASKATKDKKSSETAKGKRKSAPGDAAASKSPAKADTASKAKGSKKKKTKESTEAASATKISTFTDTNGAKTEALVKAKTSKKKKDKTKEEKSSSNQSTKASSTKRPAKDVADPPPKKKKLSFRDQVFNHMLCAFKPFTLKSLATELKSTDTILNHLMLSLTDKGLVIQKDFSSAKGRSKTLYWANHNSTSKEVHINEPATETERYEAQREQQELRTQDAALKQELAQALATPSNQQLAEQVLREEASLREVHQRLDAMKARIDDETNNSKPAAAVSVHRVGSRGAPPPKSAAQLARERDPRHLKMRINHMRDEWKKRKEKCLDFVDVLADGMEKKPKAVCQLLDIETDEMVKAVLPPKYALE